MKNTSKGVVYTFAAIGFYQTIRYVISMINFLYANGFFVKQELQLLAVVFIFFFIVGTFLYIAINW